MLFYISVCLEKGESSDLDFNDYSLPFLSFRNSTFCENPSPKHILWWSRSLKTVIYLLLQPGQTLGLMPVCGFR